MRTILLAIAAATLALPAYGQLLSHDGVRKSGRSSTFDRPTVRLDNHRHYAVHAGDGIDYCRSAGFRRAREHRGEYIRGGLARHRGGRWEYTFDGPSVARLRCY